MSRNNSFNIIIWVGTTDNIRVLGVCICNRYFSVFASFILLCFHVAADQIYIII